MQLVIAVVIMKGFGSSWRLINGRMQWAFFVSFHCSIIPIDLKKLKKLSCLVGNLNKQMFYLFGFCFCVQRGLKLWFMNRLFVCAYHIASVNSSCAQRLPPPRATAGHLPAFSVPGVGHMQILHSPGAGHLPTPGLFPSFWNAHGFLSERGYYRKKQISSSVKDRGL